MNCEYKIKNLSVPNGKVDVVLDTDAYNEIDDQFAIAYLFASKEKLVPKALYAAPFFNENSTGPKDGMKKSYDEIIKVLGLMDEKCDVFKGSETYLADESTPVMSDAAADLIARAKSYSPQNPLYVVAIGAITNVASALLTAPDIAKNIVIVWLGGHARHYCGTAEFNMEQDIAAARVVMKSGAPFVQLPCLGVVSGFTVSAAELEPWFKNKNPIADYLYSRLVSSMKEIPLKSPSRCLWDVTAVAWLLNDDDKFMLSRLEKTALPTYDFKYSTDNSDDFIRYVYHINRDALLDDMISKIIMMNA